MKNLKETVRSCFMEEVPVEKQVMSARQVRRTAPTEHEDANAGTNDVPTEKRVRDWVKSTLATAPWLALAIILFGLFAQGSIVGTALGYGLMKVAIAVVGTVIADETMFRGQKECQQSGWVPMIRRSLVFMGICWLMAVT